MCPLHFLVKARKTHKIILRLQRKVLSFQRNLYDSLIIYVKWMKTLSQFHEQIFAHHWKDKVLLLNHCLYHQRKLNQYLLSFHRNLIKNCLNYIFDLNCDLVFSFIWWLKTHFKILSFVLRIEIITDLSLKEKLSLL